MSISVYYYLLRISMSLQDLYRITDNLYSNISILRYVIYTL